MLSCAFFCAGVLCSIPPETAPSSPRGHCKGANVLWPDHNTPVNLNLAVNLNSILTCVPGPMEGWQNIESGSPHRDAQSIVVVCLPFIFLCQQKVSGCKAAIGTWVTNCRLIIRSLLLTHYWQDLKDSPIENARDISETLLDSWPVDVGDERGCTFKHGPGFSQAININHIDFATHARHSPAAQS